MISFAREKRLLLGILALLAPLPLPFNEQIGWVSFGLYTIALGVLLVRTWRGEERWLPVWGANLAAVAYLPFLLLDLQAAMGGVLVRPALRLGLYAVAIKLFSLRRERDKWHAVLGIFFLFLAAMATSVHLTVVVYLVAFLVVALLVLARFALFHLLSGFGWRAGEPLHVPLAGFLAVVSVATAVVAVPLFASLPRVASPFIGGPVGGRGGGQVSVAGFSDQVTLDSIGRLRDNRQVALRLDYGSSPPPGEVRLKGGTYERYRAGRWVASQLRSGAERDRSDSLRLADGTPAAEVLIYRLPMASRSVPVPVESLRLQDVQRWRVAVDRGGALQLRRVPNDPLDYRVELAAGAISGAVEPEPGSDAATLDLTGVTPRMIDLASTVAGTGPLGEKARRLERFLIDNYDYTLDLVGRPGDEALERFLFDDRRGHCEYFASALVLLLRTQGIHSRLITGFLGAERNALGLHVVRHGNAHAWVEAWLPDEGWQVLDPTPPGGRPGALAGAGLASTLANIYDALVFQWDRYVLTYDRDDQAETIDRLFARIAALWSRWTADEPSSAVARVAGDPAASAEPVAPATESTGRRLVLLLPILALLAIALWLRLRRPASATQTYRRLRRRLTTAGATIGEATGPLAVSRAAGAGWAAAAEPAARIVASYVKESFGGVPLAEDEREGLAPALAEVERALRRRPG
ncbi:MAG TPA: DUF3488 and transglutaminase-like domain-containing protein [Thermoanaerobaculia bacterium]|nr:DUF3488 and transglutaminase-like domain-containing protein [Thermoanaerobaculia bacterium]